MPTKTPTFGQIKAAFLAHSVNFTEMQGSSTKCRPWTKDHPLEGHVHHHTSTPSATGNVGAPTLNWILNAFRLPAANCLVGRDGKVYICGWGSVFHSGLGGPWKSRGLGEGNDGHYSLWGTEIDDPGTHETITAKQIESVGRMDAAFRSLCGWDRYAIITHGDWTVAGHYLMNSQGKPDSPVGKYVGRKNDTLRQFYPASFWRTNSDKYLVDAVPARILHLLHLQHIHTVNPDKYEDISAHQKHVIHVWRTEHRLIP